MKLHYFHGRGPLKSLVLSRAQRRVELHIKAVGDDIWALVALSGAEQGQPDRHRCQGPYQSSRQAEAALRGIAGALLGQSYDARPQAHAVWTVAAHRLARNIRTERDAHAGDYMFDPEQIEPID